MSRSCTLVVCAAPLAQRWPDVAAGLTEADFVVSVVLTDNAATWDIPRPSADQPDPRRADAWVVAPLTFNTTAKMALGLADTYAHGLLCEALGSSARVTAVPMINEDLFGHPALAAHLRQLQDAGVAILDPQTGTEALSAVRSGTGQGVVDRFDVDALVQAVLRPFSSMSWPSPGLRAT